MKKPFLAALLLFFCVLTAFGVEQEGILTWRKMVRTFAGATHLHAKVYIRMLLQENKTTVTETQYGLEFWVRDLRDYRLDILEPEVLAGITFLFRYRENYFSVLDQRTQKRANQRVSLDPVGTPALGFDPQELVSNFADFLLGLIETYNPLLSLSYQKEAERHVYTLLIREPAILTIFKKEYPKILIVVDQNERLESIVLQNQKTQETLEVYFEELTLSTVPQSGIQEAFSIRESEYPLIDYIDLR
ncbi:MAG TPA: hypothetical protein PKM99_07240 [Thermotogota bacterium]|nr:hypothetical protein [Thermotogota bacterium]MDD8053477.1 hypothetical protein [Thermotogota bacterium]HNR63635.1 hypothetical protein [Thermotogota bacterium]HNT95893.1 hypothetical protein [Thermotogota bacterium]HOZ12441.1 hypothetical protein [Thermotogota bacterium]